MNQILKSNKLTETATYYDGDKFLWSIDYVFVLFIGFFFLLKYNINAVSSIVADVSHHIYP